MSESIFLVPAIFVSLASALSVRMIRVLALRKALLDIPNERSSHKQPVPRLGGAAFVPVIWLAGALLAPRGSVPDSVSVSLLAGSVVLYGTSLADDFVSLSAAVRFVIQFLAAGLVLATAARAISPDGNAGVWLGPASPAYWLLAFWIVGLLNVYNFMDGIDGIAGLQAVVAGLGWWVFGAHYSAPLVALVGCLTAASALGFLSLNWPPAKIFMGDAGSTVIGYTFATAPLLAAVETPRAMDFDRLVLFATFLVWPFLADGTFTLLRRLRKRENIFKAHRSHLYQRLVIAGCSHRRVTCVYGGLAITGGLAGWGLVHRMPFVAIIGPIGLGLLFVWLWLWTLACERRALVKA